MFRKRELIVPIRDRRQHVRILTIRNFVRFTGVMVLALLAINVVSEMRSPRGGGFGRLFDQQRPDEITPKPAPQVVHEAQVPDTDRADSMLMAPMARAQYLGETPLTPPVVVNSASTIAAPAPAATDGGRIQIVGGADGVSIVHNSSAATPKLSGGIFRN